MWLLQLSSWCSAQDAARRSNNYNYNDNHNNGDEAAGDIIMGRRRGIMCKLQLSSSGDSKSRYFGISIPIKYSNFSRFYKKNRSIL